MTWEKKIIGKLVVAAVIGTFVVETLTNATYGYQFAGVPFGLVAVSIAFFGAYCGIQIRDIAGTDGSAWARRAVYALPFLACFVFSQWTGWNVFGAMLADGAVRQETKASRGGVARDELARLQKEQATIGRQRPVAEIEGEINVQLKTVYRGAATTVAEATKDCTLPQFAPTACKKVEVLRTELARARSAAALPGQIAKALSDLESGPQVAGSASHIGVASRVFGGLPADDIRFFLVLFVVALIGFIANFGPALIGFGGGGPDTPGTRAPHHPNYPPPGSAYGGYVPRLLPAPSEATAHAERDGRQGDAAPQATGGHTNVHGAPINLYIGSGAPGQQAVLPVAGPDTGAHLTPPSPPVAAPATTALIPLPSPAREPVRAGKVRALIDQLLTFEAACLVPTPGARVQAHELYQRYSAWAGARAIGETAFIETYAEFSEVADRLVFGGETLFEGVQIRDAGHLHVVGA